MPSVVERVGRRRRLDREDWIKAALEVLVDQSIDSVGVEPLARKLNVTKGSFYWHFKDREALLGGVIEYWRDVATRNIIKFVEEKGGTPAQRLRHILQIAVEISPSNRLEIAIRAWARHDRKVRAALVEDDAERAGYLKALYVEAGLKESEADVCAGLALSFAIGDRNVFRDEPKRASKARLERMLTMLIDDTIEDRVRKSGQRRRR